MKTAKNQNPNLIKKERFQLNLLPIPSPLFFVLACLTTLILLFCIHLFYYFPPNTITPQQSINNLTNIFIPNPPTKDKGEEKPSCNLFRGQWIEDRIGRALYYTNYTCKIIPPLKNCFLQGRKDTDFLHWRWKPDDCDIPRFSAQSFLRSLRGKTVAFIGDSLARNQMESLACLLSMVEMPKAMEKDSENRVVKWQFTHHNFTTMSLWSPFLVAATKRLINGTATGNFDLHLNKIDPTWRAKLPYIDYAIFSNGHWFFRSNYMYEDGKLLGCIYCQAPNVTSYGPGLAFRKAFRAAIREIKDCKDCKKITAFIRTFSPAHFENGAWDKGGGCNRTRPLQEGMKKDGAEWELREIQREEIEIARSSGEENGNNTFELIDVTEMMWLRADGHPGAYWGNKWMKGYSDCVHWCLPGPIDVWNEILFELINRHLD